MTQSVIGADTESPTQPRHNAVDYMRRDRQPYVGDLLWHMYVLTTSFQTGQYCTNIPLCPPTDGRRSVYLCSLPCLCIGSIGVAMSRSVPTLMFWRVVQAFGASSGLSVGAGAIGDMYKLEERGTAMGIFFGVRHFLPCISDNPGC